jgi:hypothetical protein
VRVAIDYDPALRAQSGIARYVRELVPRLLEADPEIELYLIGSRSEGMPVHPRVCPIVHGLSPRLWRVRLLLAHFLGKPRLFAPPGTDIYHATDYAFPPEGPGTGRVIVTVHDLSVFTHPGTHTWPNRVALRLFMYLLRRRRHCVMTPSRVVAEELVRRLDYPAANIFVVPLGASGPSSSAAAYLNWGRRAQPVSPGRSEAPRSIQRASGRGTPG